MKIAGVLKQLGGGPGDEGGDGIVTDALVLESPYRWGEQMVAYSRTYTPSTNAGEEGGTYGQAVPAVSSGVGYSTHLPGFEAPSERDTFYNSRPEFILDKRESDRYRHNLGVVNDSDEPLEVRLRYGALGFTDSPPEAERTFTVPAHSVRNVALEQLFPSEVFTARGPRVWIAASRPASVWLSMIDNRSGDATFVPFNTFAIQSDAETRLAIPAVAHAHGANGTFWRTDLYGYFPPIEFGNEPQQQPLASFYPSAASQCGTSETEARLIGTAGPAPPPGLFWDPYWHSVFPDIARQFESCSQAVNVTGAVELRLGSWMAGYSRTYTTRADGATFGEILPFYPAGGWPVQHFSGIEVNGGFRINVGLYNGLNRAVEHRLILYDSEGRLVSQQEITLAARESLQMPLYSIFGTLPKGLYGLSVHPLDTIEGPGRSWAYVSLVENITGDPTNWW